MRRIDRVQERLRELGIKEAEFAELLGETQQTVNNWNRRDLPKARSVEVADALGLRPEWLERGELPARVGDDQSSQPPERSRLEDMQRTAAAVRRLLRDHPETAHTMLGAGIGHLIAEGSDVPDEYLQAWLGRSGERRPGGPLTGPPGDAYRQAAEPRTTYEAGQPAPEERDAAS